MSKVALLLQTAVFIALLALFTLVLSAGGLGPDEPPPLRVWILENLKLFGVPILWCITSIVLLWRRSVAGWWLSIIGDAVLLVIVLYTFRDDMFWHTVISALVLVTVMLLAVPSVRSAFMTQGMKHDLQ